MSTQIGNEIWQVEVGGQVYEAPFAELGDWINEGSLLPSDKVRKGNLRWIEARRVPNLVPFFNAKEQGLPMPVVIQTVEAPESTATAEAYNPRVVATEGFPPVNTFVTTSDPVDHSLSGATVPTHPNPDFCALHTDLPNVYLCDGCATGFCKTCPNSYGGTVKICPFCGAMCRPLTEVVKTKSETSKRSQAISEGFGAGDFFNALGHPFKFKTSLFFGALLFVVFTLGKSAASMGGIYMVTSGLFCAMLANMLSFGVLANTIDKFSVGNLESNFMPDFDSFELWDDVIHPFFLSIGVYISSFGPFLVAMLIGFYLVVSSMSSQMKTFQQNVEKIPGTKYYDTKRTLDQSEDVKSVIGEVDRKQSERLEELEAGALDEEVGAESPLVETEDGRMVDRDTLEQEELWAMAQESRKQGLESALGKSPETAAKENEAMLQGFLALAPPLVVIGGIFFLWGVFYFPAACVVAGYTRSFVSTINPAVGLDTIKRLGGTYFKLLAMGILLLIASMLVGAIAGAILAPFNLPMFGNLPATAIGGFVGFYLWVVFSCTIGYAIYKKSDVLEITT